jgi:TolB-like protein
VVGEPGDGCGSTTGVKPGVMTALLQQVVAAPEQRASELSSLPPGTVVGRFEIVRELGRGAFGVVYEARDRELGRMVALKVVRPGTAVVGEAKVLLEAEAIARLSHPNLVTLHDVGQSDCGPYLVFELLRGKTLQDRMDEGPLPVQEAVHFAAEVARGLAHAHAEGVVHRDLKPANVFVTTKGQVKILDFGMAHAFGRGRLSGGTPAYMAPEQWEDDPEDERTDVFALGVMLHRMLSQEYPFPEDGGRWSAGAATAARPLATGAPGVGALVGRMLQKAPEGRPRDGAAVLAALEPLEETIRDHGPGGAGEDSPPAIPPAGNRGAVTPARRRRARPSSRLLGALLVAAGVAGVAAGTAWYVRKRAADPATAMKGQVAGGPSIAVLPFANVSADKDQEYFADGVTEEILNALAHVEGLRVIGRTSSFYFKGRNEDLASVARKLAVGAVLEGSVRRDGNSVRVTAQLIDTADGSRLWSETYERELTNIFQVQEDVARAVVAALQLRLLPSQALATRASRTANPEAYNLVLRARFVQSSLSQDGFKRARELFEKAAALDPTYAAPHADMALTLRMMTSFAKSPEEWAALRERALAEADRAVALGPDLGEAYSARGVMRLIYLRDWAGAEADQRRALVLSPSYAGALRRLGMLQADQGRLEEGIDTMRRSTKLDPLQSDTWNWLGVFEVAAGRFEAARSSLARAQELSAGGGEVRASLAALEILSGHPSDALALVPRLDPDDQLRFTALAQHSLGNDGASRKALDELIARFGHLDAAIIAEVHAWRGEPDQAFLWLDRALSLEFDDVKFNPFLRRLRNDSRYAALLGKMNLPVD